MAVDKVAPGIERLVSLNAEIEWLASGYGGLFEDGGVKGVAEGPVWFHDKKHLLFSDNANGKRYKWTAEKGVELYKEGTNDANGMTRDPQGRLLACEHATRRVTREELDGSITVVANNYRGFQLNRPNDICAKSDGSIYFTDPITMRVDTELDFAGVYRVRPIWPKSIWWSGISFFPMASRFPPTSRFSTSTTRSGCTSARSRSIPSTTPAC